MTIIATISAVTAAYAADAARQPRRISSGAQAEDIRLDADRNARRAETGDPTLAQLIPAATVSLDLLSPNHQPHRQLTLAQTQAAYRELDD